MSYDEDLEANSFFKCLKQDNQDLFLKAISEDWIICIPQQKCVLKTPYSLSQIMNSFLVPVDDLGLFRTLQDVEVKYEDNNLTFVDALSSENNTHVLFKETFYDDNVKKFTVLCLEDFLLESKEHPSYTKNKDFDEDLDSYHSCLEFIWAEIGNKTTINKIDHMIGEFHVKGNVVEKVAKNVAILFRNCWEEIVYKGRIKEKCQREPFYQQKLRLALETYLIHGLNHKLLPTIKTSVSDDTEILNKNLMNLQDLQLRDLGIDKQFEVIITRAKVELARVEQFFTPLGKLQCLKKSVGILSEQTSQLSSDDLLPLLVYLIIKSRIPSWCAQLKFISLFSLSAQDSNDENSYYLASMEAAIEHVKSGAIFGSSLPESLADHQQEEGLSEVSSDVFVAIAEGNVVLLKKLLQDDSVDGDDDGGTKFSHHPLCSCSSCTDLVGGPTRPVDRLTSSGLSPLHATAKQGKVTCLEAVLAFNPDLDLQDNRGNTSLQLAASAGHQNCLLLLLHAGVNYNLNNKRGDSALHLAVLHGHESCVKALLYFAEHKGVALHVNSTNAMGDTPLHLAASWGYQGILQLLLEYGASVWARNKAKLTPAGCTENYNIIELLSKQFVEDPVGFGEPKVWYKASPERTREKSGKASRKEKLKEEKTYAKEIDRLFKAILRGDDNLACFYLNLHPDKTVASEDVSSESSSSFLTSPQDSLSVPVLSSTSNACHPLCDCDICAREKLQSLLGVETDVKLSVNSQNKDGHTALHLAARTGNRKLLLLLLQSGAGVNVHAVDQGQTPLHVAIGENRGDIAELFMEYGAKVNEQDKAGNTCLHYCAIHNLENMAALLLRNNANQEVRNFAGKTAFEEARARMNFAVKKLLYE